jgi:hypothetical protein
MLVAACERVVGPRQLGGYDDENPNALVADEFGRLFIAMRDHEPTWFPLFATMAMTGMCFAEASALQWASAPSQSAEGRYGLIMNWSIAACGEQQW